MTFTVWNNIRDGVVQCMESIRAERIEQERLETMSSRCQFFRLVYAAWFVKQADKSILPRAVDLMYRPEVRAVIEQDTEQPVSRADFDGFTNHFAEWSAEWKAQCDEKLRKLVRDSPGLKGKIPDGIDPLSLASVVFTCKECSRYGYGGPTALLYPAILTHSCLYEDVWFGRYTETLPIFERAACGAARGTSVVPSYAPWSHELVAISADYEQVEEIIKAFGRDPSTATRDEMDTIDNVRIYCSNCPRASPDSLSVMGWKHAVMRHNFCGLVSTANRLL